MTTPVIVPKIGMQFLHARVINPDDRTPMLFRVTAIRHGSVYYRPVDLDGFGTKGGTQYCPVEEFGRWVKQP